MNQEIVLAFSTFPDAHSAENVAATLVGERLAACVNQLTGVKSTYLWQGKLQRDSEVLLVIKTTASQLDALEARLKTLHPYELPELVAVPVCAGSQLYLDWVRQNVGPLA